MYENLIRDVIHDQTITGNKQFNSIRDLLEYADNKFRSDTNLTNAKDSVMLHRAFLEKIRLLEYDKELFEHISNKKETAAFSSDVDADWYSKSKNWLTGKSTTDVHDKNTSCSIEESSKETKQE